MGRGWWFRFREWIWRNSSGRRAVSSRARASADAASSRRRYRREGFGARLWRWLTRLVYAFILLSISTVILFRFINPPTTLLIERERWRLGGVSQDWRPLERIPTELALAVIAAEDANFCRHRGFDIAALRKAVADWRAGGRLIGASTISQQTAKNVFLWPARSLVRKGFEFWFTALIEIFWPKQRILEVYLNVAEFGPGVFGAEMAAQSSFDRSADRLDLEQAARLAVVLPAPQRLDPADLEEERLERMRAVIDGARTVQADGRASCLE